MKEIKFSTGEGTPLCLSESTIDHFWPKASELFDYSGNAQNGIVDGVAVIEVVGPLRSKTDWWFDSYEQIVERTKWAASQTSVKAIVLSIDSPGGVASGMLDSAAALQNALNGKPMVAWAGCCACSAAYGLACAADEIFITRDGEVGSIGVITTVYDRTKANEADGYNVKVVRSGALKADPHPDVALTDASVSRVRARINELAGFFADWVASRRSKTSEEVLALQGAVLYGETAVKSGLADNVGTLDDAINRARQLADEKEKRMAEETVKRTAGDLLAKVKSVLSVTDDDAVIPSLTTIVGLAKQNEESAKEIGRLQAKLQAFEQDRQAAAKKTELEARTTIIEQAKSEGRITKAMTDDKEYMSLLDSLSLEQLKVSLKALHPAVPTGPITPKISVNATETDKKFASRYGVDLSVLEKSK